MKRNYEITVKNERSFPKGKATLIGNDKAGDGYLWLGDDMGNCIGWIDTRALDAISKAWMKLRENRKG